MSGDSFHAALRAASSARVWRLAGTIALAASGWLTYATQRGGAAPVLEDGAAEHAAELEAKREARITAAEQSALACREQSALAVQELLGVIVQQGARGSTQQREAQAAAAQLRFKRALVGGATVDQALKVALGGD